MIESEDDRFLPKDDEEEQQDDFPQPRRQRVTTAAGTRLEKAENRPLEMKSDWGYQPGVHASEAVQDQLSARRMRFGEPWRRDPGRELALLLMGLVALATIFGLSARFKTAQYEGSGAGPESTYWMESAQRYRYVRMIAAGEALPDPDVRMQAPDGYPTWSDTVLQEHAYGRAFAATGLPPESLPGFVKLLTRMVSASTVVPLALLVLALTRRRDAALIAALAYGGSLLVADRGTGQTLYREDLAFPVLTWHLAFLGLWVRRNRWIYVLAAGVLLAVALLLWKVVTFYVLLLVAFLGSAHWLGRAPAKDLWLGALLLLAPPALASLLPLSLSYDRFALSTSMLAGLAVVLAMLASRLRPQLPTLAWAAVAAVLFVALRISLPDAGGYDHAWETIRARIEHVGTKPLDPVSLSFHARHYWSGNYMSPTGPMLARGWPWLALATLPGLAALASWWRPSFSKQWEPPRFPPPLPTALLERRGPMDPLLSLSSHYVLWLVVSFVGAYLVFRKLVLFAVLAAAVLVGIGFVSGRGVGLLRRVWIGLFVAMTVLQGAGVVPGVHRALFGPRLAAEAEQAPPTVTSLAGAVSELAEVIPQHVGVDEPLLASFVISPFVLAYLDRPTVLHCFFEGDLLPRYEAVTQARMQPEEALWAQARETGARWYLHEAHHLLRTDPHMSQRYVAGTLQWPHDSVMAAMSYAPQDLERFELVWESDWFRLFRVLDEGERPKRPKASGIRPLYSRALAKGLFGDPLSPDATKQGFAPEHLLYNTLTGARLQQLGAQRRKTRAAIDGWAERDLQEALRVAPWLPGAHVELADLYDARGRADRARRHRVQAAAWEHALKGAGPLPAFDLPDPVPVRAW